MVEVLGTTAAGHVDAAEEATVRIYQYERAMQRRETARVRSADGGEVHLDIYPAEPGVRGDTGAGTVVFVGGLSNHALGYADFLDRLAERGWNVVGFDLRGHGRSSGKRGDFTMQQLLDDAQAAIDYAKERFGGPIASMGTSLGGYYSLVMTNALTDIEASISHWIFLPDLPVTKKDARMRPVALFLNKVAPWVKLPTRGVANWDEVNESAELRQRCFDDPMMVWKYTVRALAGGMTYEPARPLTELRVPTLVIIGERDKMTPFEYTRDLFEKFRGDKRLAVIPDAGHMGGLVEHQGEVLDEVDGFLAQQFVRNAAEPAATS